MPKVEYKRVRGSTSGGASSFKTPVLTIPLGIAFGITMLAGSPFQKTEKTADISRLCHWFPCEMTSEKQAQKFHTDEASLPRSG